MSRALIGLFVLFGLVGGCGFGATGSTAPDFGFDPYQPPPTGGGDGGARDGFGGADRFVSGDAGAPLSCSEPERSCAWEFAYAGSGNEQRVELYGSYRPDGWTTPEVMSFTGQSWRTAVPVPWNTQVLYQFRVVNQDGTAQTYPDPSNPNKVDNGSGGFNSLLYGVTCAQWICRSL